MRRFIAIALKLLVLLGTLAALLCVYIYNTAMCTPSGPGRLVTAEITVLGLATKLAGFTLKSSRFPTQAEGLDALAKKPAGLNEPWVQWLDEDDLLDPWGEPYQYRVPAKRSLEPYDVFSKGPDKQEGTDDDIGNWR